MKPVIFAATVIGVSCALFIILFHVWKKQHFWGIISKSGVIFLICGLILGENGLKLINSMHLSHVQPIIHFFIGWAGFVFGFQMQHRYLKKIPARWYMGILKIYVPTVFGIGLFNLACFYLWPPAGLSGEAGFLLCAVILSVITSESKSGFLIWGLKRLRFPELKGELTFISVTDNFFPLLLAGAVPLFLIVRHNSITSGFSLLYKPLTLLFTEIFFAVFIGILAFHLIHRNNRRLEVSTILIGIILMLSGISVSFRVSALFICAITGITLTNLTHRHCWLHNLLSDIEKPIYMFFLLFLGLQQSIFSLQSLILGSAAILIKTLAKNASFRLYYKNSGLAGRDFLALSFMFIPVSSIGPAFVLEIYNYLNLGFAQIISGIFIVSLFLSELISPLGIGFTKKRKRP